MKSWVCISDVFDFTTATKELIECSGQGGAHDRSLAALQKRLEEIVENKFFLLVLDDEWTATEWDKMLNFGAAVKSMFLLELIR